jgi:hypothetical protein
MLQLLLKSYFVFLLIPLLALAIEPNNPITHCDRFIGDADKAACIEKSQKMQPDWYASAACSLQDEDKNFLVCLDEIKDGDYHPEALELCAQGREISDEARLHCLQKIKNKDYTRAEIKKCGESVKASDSVSAITECLATAGTSRSTRANNSMSTKDRKPASKAPLGFQSLEIHH